MSESPIPPEVVEAAGDALFKAIPAHLRKMPPWADMTAREEEIWGGMVEAAIRAADKARGLREERKLRPAFEGPDGVQHPDRWRMRLVSDWRPVDAEPLSACCRAEVRLGGGTGVTRYYVCSVCEKACGVIRGARVDSEPSEPDADLEQAWRNGWGSALNALRACDSIAMSAHGATHADSRRILSELVNGRVESIESLTDNFVAAGRGVGFASRAHLAGPSATSEGEPSDG
jgi:hypothetical protein